MTHNAYYTLQKLFVRIAIILFWVVLIGVFLYSPVFSPLQRQACSINVFTWSGLFDTQYIRRFEEKTGIKVNLSYYESNEELLVKLRATQGRGYDLIVPGDYAVDILRRENLLQKLDKNKLNFINRLNPVLLGHYFDPENNYCIPFEWAVFGLGIDKNYFKSSMRSCITWRFAFDPVCIPGSLVMVNDPLVALPLVALYLFGSTKNIDCAKLNAIKQVLLKQRSYVQVYADFRPDYLLSTKNVPLAVASSSYIWRSMREYEHIDFVVPSQGSLVTIEHLALPAASIKQDLVYQFINFMYEPATVLHQFNTFAFLPATGDILEQVTVPEAMQKLLTLSRQQFARFDFFTYDMFESPITAQTLQDLWITVKS